MTIKREWRYLVEGVARGDPSGGVDDEPVGCQFAPFEVVCAARRSAQGDACCCRLWWRR
jgi:hypothetical protein